MFPSLTAAKYSVLSQYVAIPVTITEKINKELRGALMIPDAKNIEPKNKVIKPLKSHFEFEDLSAA